MSEFQFLKFITKTAVDLHSNDDIKTSEDLVEWLRSGLVQNLGIWGLFFSLVLIGTFWLWRNWKEVNELPGVSWLVSRVSVKQLPKATANTFSIGVADLEEDPAGEMKRLIVETLKEFPGIHVMPVPRLIVSDGNGQIHGIKGGHENARILLEQTRANALIWGTVLRHDARTIPKLYWTVKQARVGENTGKRYSPTTQDLILPQMFWEDLAEILSLVVVEGYAEFSKLEGHYYADKLAPFIERVKAGIARGIQQESLTGEALARALFVLANSSYEYGLQAGDNATLIEAVTAYRAALEEWTRERVPLQWAGTQNNLGSALQTLGKRGIISSPSVICSSQFVL